MGSFFFITRRSSKLLRDTRQAVRAFGAAVVASLDPFTLGSAGEVGRIDHVRPGWLSANISVLICQSITRNHVLALASEAIHRQKMPIS